MTFPACHIHTLLPRGLPCLHVESLLHSAVVAEVLEVAEVLRNVNLYNVEDEQVGLDLSDVLYER